MILFVIQVKVLKVILKPLGDAILGFFITYLCFLRPEEMIIDSSLVSSYFQNQIISLVNILVPEVNELLTSFL